MDEATEKCLRAAAAAGFPSDAVVLVLDERSRAEHVAALIAESSSAVVFAGDSSKDPELRSALAKATAFGRADVVVTWRSGREAARAVRRGGVVCVGAADADLPSITELVQREVVLVGAGG